MSIFDHPKVNRAIHDCLQHCYQYPAQLLPRIAEFLEGLQAYGGWKEAELRAVEKGVRKVLIFGVLDGATYPGDATDKPIGDGPPDGSKSPKVNAT